METLELHEAEFLEKRRDELSIEMTRPQGKCPAEMHLNAIKLKREWDEISHKLNPDYPPCEVWEQKGYYDIPKFTEKDYIPYDKKELESDE